MAYSSLVLYYLSQRRVPGRSFRHFFFIPTSLALVTSLLILFYISTTSNLFTHHHPNPKTPLQINSSSSSSTFSFTILRHKTSSTPFAIEAPLTEDGGGQRIESQRSLGPQLGSDGMSILNLCFWDLLIMLIVFICLMGYRYIHMQTSLLDKTKKISFSYLAIGIVTVIISF